jgi:hypothetical protein
MDDNHCGTDLVEQCCKRSRGCCYRASVQRRLCERHTLGREGGERLGGELSVRSSTTSEMAAVIKADLARWARVVKEANIKAE